mmetsp:Transcript_6523/g.19445  ORF Transcript_6523/g.19445 Transcript_6523/m.19445 type:complete len:120 (+) Transcript_6523:2720-3079(+)
MWTNSTTLLRNKSASWRKARTNKTGKNQPWMTSCRPFKSADNSNTNNIKTLYYNKPILPHDVKHYTTTKTTNYLRFKTYVLTAKSSFGKTSETLEFTTSIPACSNIHLKYLSERVMLLS